MLEYRFAIATTCMCFVLLIAGGVVHATASGLACPDWPLCNGEAFPRMVGGVLIEHGHRLIALTVALLTVALAGIVWRRRRDDAPVRAAALGAAVLVVIQALLGAATVLLRLPTGIKV